MYMSRDGKTWNGLIKQLIDGETDLSSAGLTQTLSRDTAADFSIPVATSKSTLITTVAKGQADNFWVFTEIFPPRVWIV